MSPRKIVNRKCCLGKFSHHTKNMQGLLPICDNPKSGYTLCSLPEKLLIFTKSWFPHRMDNQPFRSQCPRQSKASSRCPVKLAQAMLGLILCLITSGGTPVSGFLLSGRAVSLDLQSLWRNQRGKFTFGLFWISETDLCKLYTYYIDFSK